MVRDADSGKYRRTRLFVVTLSYSRKAVRLLGQRSSAQVWAELHQRAFRRLGGTGGCPGFSPKAPVRSGRTSPLFDPTLGWSGRLCPVFRPVRTAVGGPGTRAYPFARASFRARDHRRGSGRKRLWSPRQRPGAASVRRAA